MTVLRPSLAFWGKMTKCPREQGDRNNFREQKAGNKFESKLGKKGTKF